MTSSFINQCFIQDCQWRIQNRRKTRERLKKQQQRNEKKNHKKITEIIFCSGNFVVVLNKSLLHSDTIYQVPSIGKNPKGK